MKHLFLLYSCLFFLKNTGYTQTINRLYYTASLAANTYGFSSTHSLSCQFMDRFSFGLFLFKDKEYAGYSQKATGPSTFGLTSSTHTDRLYNLDLGLSPMFGVCSKDLKGANFTFSLGPSWTKHAYYSNFDYYIDYYSNSNQVYKSHYDFDEQVYLGITSKIDMSVVLYRIFAFNVGGYANFNSYKMNYGFMLGLSIGMVRNNKDYPFRNSKKKLFQNSKKREEYNWRNHPMSH